MLMMIPVKLVPDFKLSTIAMLVMEVSISPGREVWQRMMCNNSSYTLLSNNAKSYKEIKKHDYMRQDVKSGKGCTWKDFGQALDRNWIQFR